VHQSGQHPGRSGRSSGPHDRVHHPRCRRPQEQILRGIDCSTRFVAANLRPENRPGHHITFARSTHSASTEHALSQQLSTQEALTCDDAKVNGIGMKPGMVQPTGTLPTATVRAGPPTNSVMREPQTSGATAGSDHKRRPTDFPPDQGA
jgi:hypothetical protein